MTHALLPSGLQDLLPPDAAREQRIITELLTCFAAQGYQQVTPPLVEFEDTLLDGKGRAYAAQTFRVPDPLSQQMMGLRADITTQIARIASTQLADWPKPLRLSYAGRVLRSVSQGLSPDRQLVQSGYELIGIDSVEAIAEVLLLAIESVRTIGVKKIVLDLTLAGLLEELLAPVTFDSDEARDAVLSAVKHKDAAALPAGLPVRDLLLAFLSLPLDAKGTLARLRELPLPARIAGWREQMEAVAATLAREAPDVRLTIDPLESHGFEFQEGLCFSFFDAEHGREIARGGRYLIQDSDTPAFGATIYIRALLECGYLPFIAKPKALLAPGTTEVDARALRAEGYITLRALGNEATSEAKALGCTHLWQFGKLQSLS